MLLTTIILQTVLATAVAAPDPANHQSSTRARKAQSTKRRRTIVLCRPYAFPTPLLGTLAEVLINLLDLPPCEMECGACACVCIMAKDVKRGHMVAGWQDAIYIGCTDRHYSLATIRATNTEAEASSCPDGNAMGWWLLGSAREPHL